MELGTMSAKREMVTSLCHPELVEIPASEDERQGSNGGEAERLGSRYHLMTASLCYFHLVRIALCKDISLEGCHLLGTRSQAPLPCCLILTARALARSGFRLRIRSAQDDIQRDVRYCQPVTATFC